MKGGKYMNQKNIAIVVGILLFSILKLSAINKVQLFFTNNYQDPVDVEIVWKRASGFKTTQNIRLQENAKDKMV